ncbi:hypothetical protein ACET3X_007362 [Alternaria dauci]|uniref:Oxidoreductase-like protein n=1 Tax=Alternaria dauci TaxID=48095 RepID=A0ABR3UEC5_9PLEO
MATPIIEARSLSSLTALASNPPAYPRNPTHQRHEPLVLYIARVPGSRDVFLSPMKPREKVVTAEDIQSSLYFVHVEQPEDAYLVDPPESQNPEYMQQSQNSSNSAATPIVPRKAVPGMTTAPTRKPVPNNLASINKYSDTQNIDAGNYARRSAMLAPELSHSPRRSFDSSQYNQENRRPTASPRRRSENQSRVSASLILIRRDPASGAQWNVARIEDPPVLDISSPTANDPSTKKKTGAPMYIEVYSPGYSKFLHSDATSKPPLMSRDSGTSIQSLQAGSHQSANESVFRRRIWMEGSQHTGGFGHKKINSRDYNTGRPDSRGSQYAQTNSASTNVRPVPTPPFVTREEQTYGSIQVSDRQTSFRGYVFTSPWNGRCEFVTGIGGGSLKCRHIVSGLQGAPPTPTTVSEVRFNLPSTSKVTTPRGEESSKRSSFFRRGRHSRTNSSLSLSRDEETEDARNSLDRLDLSLGQEFAGGGFGGKQAKLGKIILEDEGLKMMDLLVAANMGLWWRAYEKASGGSTGAL